MVDCWTTDRARCVIAACLTDSYSTLVLSPTRLYLPTFIYCVHSRTWLVVCTPFSHLCITIKSPNLFLNYFSIHCWLTDNCWLKLRNKYNLNAKPLLSWELEYKRAFHQLWFVMLKAFISLISVNLQECIHFIWVNIVGNSISKKKKRQVTILSI